MKVDSKTLVVASLTMAAIACGPAPAGPTGVGGAPVTVGVGVGAQAAVSAATGFTGMTSSEAKAFFAQKVYPALITECGQCHAEGQFKAPVYLAGGADAAYDFMHAYNSGALVAEPDKNLLLLKDRHEGPDISSPVRAAVIQWLALEYPDFQPQPTVTVYDRLVNFGQCLSKTSFKAFGIDQLFNLPTDNNACTCATCHNKANNAQFGGGLLLDPDTDATFLALQKFPGMMIFAQGQVADTGAFIGLTESNRVELKGREININGPNQTACACDPNNLLNPVADFGVYCHPTYTINDALIDQIEIFASTAIERERTLQCDPNNSP